MSSYFIVICCALRCRSEYLDLIIIMVLYPRATNTLKPSKQYPCSKSSSWPRKDYLQLNYNKTTTYITRPILEYTSTIWPYIASTTNITNIQIIQTQHFALQLDLMLTFNFVWWNNGANTAFNNFKYTTRIKTHTQTYQTNNKTHTPQSLEI